MRGGNQAQPRPRGPARGARARGVDSTCSPPAPLSRERSCRMKGVAATCSGVLPPASRVRRSAWSQSGGRQTRARGRGRERGGGRARGAEGAGEGRERKRTCTAPARCAWSLMIAARRTWRESVKRLRETERVCKGAHNRHEKTENSLERALTNTSRTNTRHRPQTRGRAAAARHLALAARDVERGLAEPGKIGINNSNPNSTLHINDITASAPARRPPRNRAAPRTAPARNSNKQPVSGPPAADEALEAAAALKV
jgi:hypothetical protein